jgi:hypothetical protein
MNSLLTFAQKRKHVRSTALKALRTQRLLRNAQRVEQRLNKKIPRPNLGDGHRASRVLVLPRAYA